MLNEGISKTKGMLALSGSHICFGLVTILLYEHVVTPAYQFLPHIPVFLYNFLATAISLLFLAGILVAAWQILKESFRHIVFKELRSCVAERIRSWPNSKWDIVWSFLFAYFFLIATLTLVVTQLIPKERLVGVFSPEEAQSIAVFMLIPLMLLIIPLAAREMFGMYKDTKRQWKSGSQRERVALAASTMFVAVAYGVVLLGDYAGWDHLLWFNAA